MQPGARRFARPRFSHRPWQQPLRCLLMSLRVRRRPSGPLPRLCLAGRRSCSPRYSSSSVNVAWAATHETLHRTQRPVNAETLVKQVTDAAIGREERACGHPGRFLTHQHEPRTDRQPQGFRG
jgi:hypothetical protein